MRDIKELIGITMRVLDGVEITEDDVLQLDFEADGELLAALNETYIKLLEFVHDRDARRTNVTLDAKERADLQASLHKIVRLCDVSPS